MSVFIGLAILAVVFVIVAFDSTGKKRVMSLFLILVAGVTVILERLGSDVRHHYYRVHSGMAMRGQEDLIKRALVTYDFGYLQSYLNKRDQEIDTGWYFPIDVFTSAYDSMDKQK
jgi:hypothetical protein